METPVLVLSGPVGVGKTSVGGEVSEVLNLEGVPHTFVDFDQLRYTYPRTPEDPWGDGLAFQNLEAIWANCKRQWSRNLIVSSVVEDWSFIDHLSRAIPGSRVITFQLFASPGTLKSRVEKREIGSGLDWHKSRAIELLSILSAETVPCNWRIDTEEKSITDLAEEIVRQVSWKT